MSDMELEKSVFAKGLIIEGNVETASSIVVQGDIRGNITCSETVEISQEAQVKGDIKAKTLILDKSHVSGNIDAQGVVEVGVDTYVKGDISAASLEIAGFIEGDIVSQGEISFAGSAKVLGNVSAQYIDVEKGAKISGSMKIGAIADKE